jgi:hypothetical protein
MYFCCSSVNCFRSADGGFTDADADAAAALIIRGENEYSCAALCIFYSAKVERLR